MLLCSVAEQNEHKSIEEYSEFLRKKTYMLANSFNEANKLLSSQNLNLNLNLKTPKPPKEIVFPANHEKMVEEVEKLRATDCRFFQSKNYEVFFWGLWSF